MGRKREVGKGKLCCGSAVEETTVRNGRKGEGDGGNGNRILGDERKERLEREGERKGQGKGRLGKGSEGRKGWKGGKGWKEGNG